MLTNICVHPSQLIAAIIVTPKRSGGLWRSRTATVATPVPVTEIGRLPCEMEEGGWDGLAVGEAHGLLPDPYVALGLAAEATTTLKVGTAVAVPLRHPLLAAGAMATVQGISGGRASFSLGRGDGAMKVLQRDAMPV